ncbi:hypothetical protein CDL12_14744 [Handroanthus impetiginosus]|uniref:RNase H type-1 domain-containing protein n=1 Tax=Handroanthus impetiginosus TaxID=429701 RepID=A0A2G9H578_9LAMI|nr:hypothetical protein CDL12_14744 [Handroanthus impetiginosus]
MAARTIIEIPVNTSAEDTLVWKLSNNCSFKTSIAWNIIRQRQDVPIFGWIWLSFIIPTISIFLWHLLHDKLAIDTRLQQKGIHLASRCMCLNMKNLLHISSLLALMQMRNSTPYATLGHIRTVVPILIFWHIWEARNNAKYWDKKFFASKIIHRIIQHLHNIYAVGKMGYKHWKSNLQFAKHLGLTVPRPTPKIAIAVTWLRPTDKLWKLNTDGATCDSLCSNAGGILHDQNGNAVFAFTHFLGAMNSIEAEIEAVLSGLQHC